MAAISRPEKMTETFAVKMPDAMLRDLRAVAEAAGEEAPEYVRRLIAESLERERARYRALHTIFGSDDKKPKVNLGEQENPVDMYGNAQSLSDGHA